MFMGPMDGSPDFRDSGIEGTQRFLNRVWRLIQNPKKLSKENEIQVRTKMHKTISGVTEDIKEFKYNTAIAKIMEYVNLLQDRGASKLNLLVLIQLLAPFAPHLTEELWVEKLGQKFSIHQSPWPIFDPKFLKVDSLVIAVQVNGKLRGQLIINNQITLPAQAGNNQQQIEKLARNDKNISKWLEGHQITKVIYVPGRIINFVSQEI